MKVLSATYFSRLSPPARLWQAVLYAFLIHLFCLAVFAIPEISTSEDNTTIIVNSAPDQEVYAIGKSVVVNNHAKGVLAVGGDVIVNGRVDGDVATIGGNVVQKEQAYIGGDIIVFGGSYRPEAKVPLRESGKETVTFGVFEEELRSFGQNPSGIFSPTLSLAFFAQRVVVVLLWFIVSLAFTTVAPGAVSRAVSRVNLSPVKVCAIGSGVFLLASVVLIGGALTMPSYLAATLLIMGSLLFLLSYVFGRVSLQVALGKQVQKHFLSQGNRSETLATLIGVAVVTFVLSLPYVWLIAFFAIFAFGIGLIITARSAEKRPGS